MAIQMLGVILCVLLLIGGCATSPLPGAVGEIRGPLRSIDLQTDGKKGPSERYRTAPRDRFFASDREVWVYLHWGLPGPGSYKVRILLQTPLGATYSERDYSFEAKETYWLTRNKFDLPQGADTQRLAGLWQIEAFLDGAAVGRRTFTFDPSSIRLRTDARIVIVQGTSDPELAAGDWVWLNRAAALEDIQAAHKLLGVTLRDELARRFPHVEGPLQQPTEGGAAILLRTKFSSSPSPNADAHLDVAVVPAPPQKPRTFRFTSSAGIELLGQTRKRNSALGATDLAFQAMASQEFLDFLVAATKATPE
jgi:hypothetical protein